MRKAASISLLALLTAMVVTFLNIFGFLNNGYVSYGVKLDDTDKVRVYWRFWYHGEIINSGVILYVEPDRVSEVKDSLEIEFETYKYISAIEEFI